LVLIEEHLLEKNIIARFHPDFDMAAAWQRLIDNNFVQSDLLLLLHEYAESFIMNGIEVEWRTAHGVVIKFYNWDKSLY